MKKLGIVRPGVRRSREAGFTGHWEIPIQQPADRAEPFATEAPSRADNSNLSNSLTRTPPRSAWRSDACLDQLSWSNFAYGCRRVLARPRAPGKR